MGIWNSHTSVGNILGGLVAGAEADSLSTWYVFSNRDKLHSRHLQFL